MARTAQPRRAFLLAPFAVLVAAIALHGVYWVVVSGQIVDRAHRWIASQEAAGYAAEHGGISVNGYPFRFSLRVETPDLTAPDTEGGWRARVDRLAATAQFYDLNHWIITPDGTAIVEVATSRGSARYAIAAQSAQLSVSGSGGATTRVGASVSEVTLTAQQGPAPAVEAVGALALSGVVSPDDALILRVQADAVQFSEGVLTDAMSAAFGSQVNTFRMEAAVGRFSALARAGGLAEWRDAGGQLDIARTQLVWGVADLNGEGAIGLDEALLPAGRLSVVVTNPETLITALVQAGLVHDEQGEALRLAALMAPRREGGIALPFRLREGALFLGPARLGAFAEPASP